MQVQGPPDSFRVFKLLHIVLLTGITVFTLISLVLKITDVIAEIRVGESTGQVLQVIAALLSTGALLLGFNLFRKKASKARNSPEDAHTRMEIYRGACLAWWAMIEAPGLFAIICFMLTGNYAFFALGLFHVVILAVFMPRRENIILLLNLSQKEADELSGKV